MRLGTSAAACMLLAGTADAATQTQTVAASGGWLAAVPLFDPALGRLLSVYAEASYTSIVPFLSAFAPVGGDHAVAGTATIANSNFALAGTSQATAQPGYWTFTVTATGNVTWSDPAVLAAFEGRSGSVLGYAGASATAPGTLIGGSFAPSVSYKVTYTYDASPAVPEPATWAMMVGGFVMVGLALRAARRPHLPARAPKA